MEKIATLILIQGPKTTEDIACLSGRDLLLP
jgi:hypothetical protein